MLFSTVFYRFTLRQVHYDPPRRTELFIVLTMYNEDEVLFTRSFQGVFKNIAHLCKRDRSKTWGKDGWKKVVVCVVSDGRGKVSYYPVPFEVNIKRIIDKLPNTFCPRGNGMLPGWRGKERGQPYTRASSRL